MIRGGKGRKGGKVEVVGIYFRNGEGGGDCCLFKGATAVTLQSVARLRHQMLNDNVSPFSSGVCSYEK